MSRMTEVAYRELLRTAMTHECSECGGLLGVAFQDGQLRIRCGNDKAHQGHRKIKSYSQMYDEGEGLPITIANNIEKRRRKMAEQQDTRLAQYHGVTSLKKEEAELIVKTIWPDATQVERTKAVMVCRDYGLNPLMKHVFLIPFGKQWAMVLGIKAKRLIAAREGPYNYADGPRIMTEAEQTTIRQQVIVHGISNHLRYPLRYAFIEAPGIGAKFKVFQNGSKFCRIIPSTPRR